MPQDIKTVITNQIKQDINENIKDDIVLKAKFFKMICLQTKNGDNNMFPKLLVYLSCMSENRNANISKENIDSLVSLVENNNILEFKEKLEIITNYNFVSEAITKSKEFYYNFVYNKKDIDEFFDNLGSLTELNEQFTSFINKNYYFDYKEKTFKQSSQNWTEEKGCEFLRNSEVLTKLNNNNNFLKATIVNEIKNDSSSILLTTNDKLPKDSLSIVTKNKVVKNNVSCFTKELVNKRRAVPQSKLKKVVSLDEIDNLFDKYIKIVSDYANLYESVGKTLSKLYLQYQSEDNFKLFFENEKIGSNLNELGKNEIKKLYQIWNKDYSHKTNDELLMTTANKLNLFLMHHYIPKDDKERNEIIQLINNLENSQNINLSEKINSKIIFEGLKLLEDKKYYQRWPDRNHLLIESYKILLTDVWKKSFEPDFEQTVKFLSKTFDDITSKTVSFLNSSIYSKAECLQWMEQGEELSKRSISITLYLMPKYEHATHSHKKQLKVAYSKFQKFIDDKKYEKICDILDKYSLFQRSSKLNNSFRRKNIISKYVNKIVTDEEVSFIDCLRKKCKLFSENGTRSRLYIMPLISHQNKVKEELFPKQEDNLKLIQPVYQEVLIGANNKKNKRDSKSDVIDFSHLSSQEELCISEIDNNEKQQKRKEKAESLKKQYNEISE